MTNPEKKKPFLSLFTELSEKNEIPNGHHYPSSVENSYEQENDDSTFLTDEMDHQILMHRDAHFGGDFEVMLDYYNADEGIGINPEFEIERIDYLAEVEKEIGEDLAPLILSGVEAEAVGKARQAYSQIKSIYEIEDEQNIFPRLIADLILSEEEEPLQEIEAIVEQGKNILPNLLALLQADDFFDPLFPGYGYAPYLAILCLGKIGDSSAIIPLFETLSKTIIFDEMVVIESLAEIGNPAKEFLLKTIQSRPITQDNTNAAFALTAFSHDPKVAISCFEQLHDSEIQDKPLLRTYLICNCDALDKTLHREAFIIMAQNQSLPSEMRSEMANVIEGWE